MKRVDKLRKEYNTKEEDGRNSMDNNSDKTISKDKESRSDNGQLQRQIAEEKAAARVFPLNLISSRFKSKDPNVLKGKSRA